MKKRLSEASPAFVCSVLVMGIGELILKLYEVTLPYYTVFAWAAVFVFSLYILFINKKVALIAFAVSAITLLIIYLNLDSVKQEAILKFISDSFNFLLDKTKPLPQSESAFGVIFIFILSLIFIIPVVIHPFYPAVLILAGIPLFMQWKAGKPSSLVDTIIIIGVFACLFSYKHKQANNLDARKLNSAITFYIIPSITIIMLIIYASTIDNPLNHKSKWLEIRKNTISDMISEFTGNTAPRSIYSLSSTGFSPIDGRLGGPVTLDDEESIQVTSSYAATYFLRGNIKNKYTGYNWIDDTESYRLRMNSKNKQTQIEVFNLYLPDISQKEDMYYRQAELLITPLSTGSATIFTPNRVINATPEKALTMLVSFNSEGEVFASRRILEDLSYKITAEHIRIDSSSFGNYIEEIQSATDGANYIYDDFIYQNYMFPFESVPESVWNLAEVLTEDAANDYQKATLIKEYLQNGFTYTLSPEIPPEDIDFVSHFLETRKGYCTYYATAMAVLSRCAGLPSRYVEGFKAKIKTADKPLILTNENAHAWAEIYIRGMGWLPFDPLTSQETTGPAVDFDLPFEKEILPITTPQPETDYETEYVKTVDILPIIIIVLIMVVLAVIVVAFILLSQYQTDFDRVSRRKSTPNNIAKFYFSEIMILLSYIKYKKPDGFTLNKYAKGVDSKILVSKLKFKDIVLVINKLLYSKSELSQDEVLFIYDYYVTLKASIKKKYGKIRYLFIIVSMLFSSLGRTDRKQT